MGGETNGTPYLPVFTAEGEMKSSRWIRFGGVVVLSVADLAQAADHMSGQVLGGGAPIAKSTTCGWPIRRAARSRSCAARVPRTARPAKRPATRFHPPAATSADHGKRILW